MSLVKLDMVTEIYPLLYTLNLTYWGNTSTPPDCETMFLLI